MATDWSARTAAIEHFERLVRQLKRVNDEDKELYEAALHALRRSQDHTAIQTKLNSAMSALKVYTHCRHAWVDCLCTKEARAVVQVGDYANDTGVEEKDMPAGSPRHIASEKARAEMMKQSLQTSEVQR